MSRPVLVQSYTQHGLIFAHLVKTHIQLNFNHLLLLSTTYDIQKIGLQMLTSAEASPKSALLAQRKVIQSTNSYGQSSKTLSLSLKITWPRDRLLQNPICFHRQNFILKFIPSGKLSEIVLIFMAIALIDFRSLVSPWRRNHHLWFDTFRLLTIRTKR